MFIYKATCQSLSVKRYKCSFGGFSTLTRVKKKRVNKQKYTTLTDLSHMGELSLKILKLVWVFKAHVDPFNCDCTLEKLSGGFWKLWSLWAALKRLLWETSCCVKNKKKKTPKNYSNITAVSASQLQNRCFNNVNSWHTVCGKTWDAKLC